MSVGMGRRSAGRVAAGCARGLLLWAALCAALASTAVAAATPLPSKGAADDPLARAQASIDAADCPTAVRILAQAYGAKPPPRALIQLGYCHRKEGALDQAAQDYTRLIQEHPASPLAKRAQELLVHVEEERIARRARGAEAIRSASGTPVVAAAATGTIAVALSATSTEGAPLPIAATSTPSPPVLAVAGSASGTSAGPPPAPFDPTEPERPARPDHPDATIAAPNRAFLPPPPPASPEPEGRVWSWVAAAGAAAALGTGAVFISAANSTKSEYESQIAPRARKDELASQFDAQRSRAGLLLVTGAVLAASAGLLFVLHF